MSREMEFFIFLIEQYAQNHKTTANNVLELWDNLGLSELIYNMYERYHCEVLDNAFKDIDNLIQEKQNAV